MITTAISNHDVSRGRFPACQYLHRAHTGKAKKLTSPITVRQLRSQKSIPFIQQFRIRNPQTPRPQNIFRTELGRPCSGCGMRLCSRQSQFRSFNEGCIEYRDLFLKGFDKSFERLAEEVIELTEAWMASLGEDLKRTTATT